MNPAVTSELRKLNTLHLPRVLAGVATALAAVIGFANAHTPQAGERFQLAQTASAAAESAWFLVMVVAVLAAAGEFQHHTIRTTFLSTPRRVRVLGAKAVVAGAYGMTVTAAVVLVTIAAALITTTVEGTAVASGSVTAWSGVAFAAGLGGLWAVLASGLGVLTRSTALALTTLLLWRFVVEGVLPVVLRRPELAHWTPTGTATTVVSLTQPTGTVLASVLVLVAYAALICTAAGLLLVRRDPA
jgi:ABC-2 type transport system permease protein